MSGETKAGYQSAGAEGDAGTVATAAPDVTATMPPRTPGTEPTVAAPLAEASPGLAVVDPTRYARGPEIARGGMGRIVEARDVRLGRPVAVKELLHAGGAAATRFEREALISARLQHPAIVAIYEAGLWPSGEPFYAMKRVVGRSLDKVVAAATTLGARLALIPNVLAVFDALAYAHDKGIIHRDLKPANVLVGDYGETVVIDWGLAKDLDGNDDDASSSERTAGEGETVAGAVMGTPSYMPPEQARGERVDRRADVYSLGALLYYVLSGAAPHTGKTLEQILQAVLTKTPSPIRALAGMPPDLATIVEKAMAREPAERYADAAELAEDLRRFQTGQLVGAHQYSRRTLLARWVRRHRTAVAVGAAMFVVSAIALAIAFQRISSARELADDNAQLADDQKRIAEQRADQLALETAASIATTDPTRAVAIMQPLATGDWRRVRAIANAARVTGVARSLATDVRGVAGDGALAFVVRGTALEEIDVARGTRRTLATVAGVGKESAQIALSDQLIVVRNGGHLTVVDRTSGSVRSLAVGATDITLAGRELWWIDGLQFASRLTPDGPQVMRKLETIGPMEVLALSPDGKRLAAGGRHGFALIEVASPDVVKRVLDGFAFRAAWSADGQRLAVSSGDDVAVIETATSQILHRIALRDAARLFVDGRSTVVSSPAGVTEVQHGGGMSERPMIGQPLGLAMSRHGLIAASTREVLLFTIVGTKSLAVRGQVSSIAAAGDFALAVVDGRLLAWDLKEILPRRLVAEETKKATFVGGRVVAINSGGELVWFDLRDGSTTRDAAPGDLIDLQPVGDDHAYARGQGVALVAAGKPVERISDGWARLAIDDHRILIDHERGLAIYDLQTHKTTEIAGSPNEATTVAGDSRRIAAGTRNRLWRYDLATGTSDSIAQRADALAVIDDGILVLDHNKLFAWRSELQPIATLPATKDLSSLVVVGRRAIASGFDASSYLVELDSGKVRTLPPVSAVSPTGLCLIEERVGVLEVYDPEVDARWTLVTNRGKFSRVGVSRDGTRVLAAGLLVWTLFTPDTGSATAAAVAGMTDARIGPDQQLVWGPPP